MCHNLKSGSILLVFCRVLLSLFCHPRSIYFSAFSAAGDKPSSFLLFTSLVTPMSVPTFFVSVQFFWSRNNVMKSGFFSLFTKSLWCSRAFCTSWVWTNSSEVYVLAYVTSLGNIFSISVGGETFIQTKNNTLKIIMMRVRNKIKAESAEEQYGFVKNVVSNHCVIWSKHL